MNACQRRRLRRFKAKMPIANDYAVWVEWASRNSTRTQLRHISPRSLAVADSLVAEYRVSSVLKEAQ